MRRHKYNAKAVKDCPHCGFTHPSQMEAARCEHLHFLARLSPEHGPECGAVHIDVHPKVTLGKGIHYSPDFLIYYAAEGMLTGLLFEEVKGRPTADFKLKRKLFENNHPCELRVVTGRKTKSGWTWKEI